jgi:hypothetical protein
MFYKKYSITMKETKQYLNLYNENMIITLFEKLSIVKILYSSITQYLKKYKDNDVY